MRGERAFSRPALSGRKRKDMVPVGRPGRADEVAETILFLLSDAASYVTGALLNVSGGR